jgi:DNA-binding response OmpR family regulator
MPNDASGVFRPAQDVTYRRRILVVDADPALYGLIEEWLTADGYQVMSTQGYSGINGERIDLAIIDSPFPRSGGLDWLKRIADKNPGTPVLALSSSFFAGVESTGAVARSLGVAAVLPKPLKRDALLMAVRKLLPAVV